MQTIGERLEEARKRGGISLREASEATKIRPDYLQLMEGNNFSFNVPDVYKRGFLKIYGRYLKLDADKLAADYTAQTLGGGAGSRRESRDTLGRMDAPGREGGNGAEPEPHYPGAPAGGLDTRPGGDHSDRSALVRLVALLVLAAVALVGLSVFLSNLMNSGGSPDDGAPPPAASNPPAAGTSATTPPAGTSAAASTGARGTPPPAPAPAQLRFTAKEDISNLTVRQRSDGREIFNGQLRRGQGVSAAGPVEVSVTQAENLTVETNGGAAIALGRPGGGLLTGPAKFNWPPPGYAGAP